MISIESVQIARAPAYWHCRSRSIWRKHIVWSYGNPADTTILNGSAFASRLENVDTLITDSGWPCRAGRLQWRIHPNEPTE